MSERRSFLMAACGCVAGATLPGCVTIHTVRGLRNAGAVEISRAEFEAFAVETKAVLVRAEGLSEPLILLEKGGAFRALSSTCTHQQCQVRPGKAFLRCPCHGSTYDLEGRVVRGPAPKDLPAYPVRLEDGRILIEVPT